MKRIIPILCIALAGCLHAQTPKSTLATATQLANEAAARIAADQAEATARANADTTEATARANADAIHTNDIAVNAAAITAETTRATAAEADLAADITAETTRATTAETDISTNLNSAVAGLGASISQLETTRAFEDGRTINDSIIHQSNTGTIADLMSRQAKAIKEITGKANWLTTPAISLESVNTSLANKQPLNSNLTAFGGLANAADKMPYFTGAGGAATATVTSAGRALIDDVDAAAQRTTLALDSTSSVQFLDLTVDALKSTASHVVGVTASGNFAASDNGKRVNVTGTAAVTRTMVSGLASGFFAEIANNTTSTGSLLIAASGVTLNGGTASIRVERGAKARIEYVSSNAYAVTIVPQASPRIELANMMPTPLAWSTATTTANTTNTYNYFSWAAGLNNGAAVAGNHVLFPLADCPLTRPGSGANMRLNGSRFAFATDMFCNGFSNSEIRILFGVASGVTSLSSSGLGVVFTGYQTAKLQIHDGTTLTESSSFSIGDFDIGRLNRFLVAWDGETGTFALYQENHAAQLRPDRFVLKGSVTATPPTTGSGDSCHAVLYATGTPGFNISLRQRGSYWFNDLVTP